MFKVECPGCKAPYQVDERRVPPNGLKMRCPKCGSSFQVDPPTKDAAGRSPDPVLGASLGLPREGGEAPAKPPLPRKKPAMKGTMIGVAPPTRAAEPKAPIPPPEMDLPAPRGAEDPFAELDLPAPRAESPAVAAGLDLDLPAPRAPGQPAGSGLDLPSPAAPRQGQVSRPEAPRGGRPPLPRPAAPVAVEADLPAPRAASPAADPFAELDLPAPAAPAGAKTRAGGFDDLPAVAAPDLPAPAMKRPAVPASATGPARPARGGPAGADLEVDLPSPSIDLDLPSPGGVEADLPSPGFDADLPSPGLDVDLPSVGFDNLPSVSGRAGLPAARSPGGFGEIDLPMATAELPAPAAAGLPARTVAGIGLPSPAGAGLPAHAAGLPVPAGSLPALPDDPFGAPSSGFGGQAAGDPFGSDPFGAPPPGREEASAADAFGSPGAPDPFGAPPSADPFGAPSARGGPSADPFGAPRGDPFARTTTDTGGPLGGDPFGSGGHGEGESAPPQQADQARPLVRGGGGGTAYGEVNLDDGAAGGGVAIEDDLPRGDGGASAEFSDLPSEGTAAAPASLSRARAPAAAVPGGAVAEIQARRRRQRLRVVVGTVVAAALAGGALTLVPAVGPFGAYFIVDQIRHGEYERLLAATSDAAHRELGADTYPDAEKAVGEVEAAAQRAKRFKPLAAYTAFVGFARTLRYGAESAVYARARVALDDLADASDVDKLDLARATRAAADGDIARARKMLGDIARISPRDIDAAVVRGELELRAKDAKAALEAWSAAQALEKTARTAYGMARAKLSAGDVPEARKLAEEAMRLNPRHIGGRLLLAETAWSGKRDEASATKLLDEVLHAAQDAGPEERIEANTLFGEIHLNRGRVTQAEQSFGEAIRLAEQIKLNARAARALSGFGEALFRAGRYSQAIARFKAAAQADADDVTAQVGVAKCSLELERLDDAKDMLGKLRKSYPKHMQVAYWYGRVQEALGERKEAESAYREAIATGADDPDAVNAYIALASVLSAQGQLDAANASLSEAQKRLPASPALYKALGRVAMTQGRYADGLKGFEHALELDTEDVEARFLSGTALVRLRQFDKALEIFDAVAKVDRDFPGLALERGILFQESGRTEEALREYEAALAKAPNDPDLMLKVGCGKAEAGNGPEAEKLLRKVLEQRQNSAETHFCLGRALMAKHNLSDAIKSFERAIQIDPNHAEYHLYVGWACNEAGSLAKATTALKRALELDQGLADAYWQRGVLRVRQTRPKDAIEDLTRALELRPSRYEAHADLALAYYDLGKEDLALSEWQKAIAANPSEATWRFHYGKLLNLRLQNAAAAEQLGKAIELADAQGGSLPWLSEAHRLAALSLGNSQAAVAHWQAFLKTGAANSPYRNEAKAALKRLGAPWEE